jgi:hypothetical protein
MENNSWNLKLFQFSQYLYEIGILSKRNINKFQKYFNEISVNISNNKDIYSNDIICKFIYLKECIVSALVYYLKSLSVEDLKIVAINIYDKYNIKCDKINDSLIKVLDIYSKKDIKYHFNKWKSETQILTKSLKKEISSNILSNIKKSLESKYIYKYNKDNMDNQEDININNNLKNFEHTINNSMLKMNHNLNISTNPDLYNRNNNNNYSFNDISLGDYNYSYDTKNKRKFEQELNKTYSNNYYKKNNNIYQNDSYNYIQNYLNKTNSSIKPPSHDYYSGNNSAFANNNNNYNNNYSTIKSSSNPLKVKTKVNLDYISNLSKIKTEHNLIPERTTEYIKEQQELKNFCTFKPKINKSSSFSRYSNIPYKRSSDRLYLDSKNRLARKELESLKKSSLESKQNTFKPKFISSSVKKVKSDFDKRLKEFEINKKNKIKKISEDLEEEQKQQYTFSPKINDPNNSGRKNNYYIDSISNYSTVNKNKVSKNSKNNRHQIPVYKRLYNENKNKLLRQERREKEEMDKIRKNSSKISEGNNNNLLDRKKIEELYNDYKFKQMRLKLKKEEIEKEQGITFQPELISEKKYYDKINPDFYQREKIFLEKQQKNIEIYKEYLESEKMGKKYSEEEKKEIYNNIVNKLYKNGIERYKQRQEKSEYKFNTIDDISDSEIKYNNIIFKNN